MGPLELAAGRLGVWSLDEVAERLSLSLLRSSELGRPERLVIPERQFVGRMLGLRGAIRRFLGKAGFFSGAIELAVGKVVIWVLFSHRAALVVCTNPGKRDGIRAVQVE